VTAVTFEKFLRRTVAGPPVRACLKRLSRCNRSRWHPALSWGRPSQTVRGWEP